MALLERIIKASSNEGDVVFDPFCGCATTLEAAHSLKRRRIGSDIAIHAIKREMEKAGTLKVRGKRHPRLQLLSVPDILAGRRFKLPEAPAARGVQAGADFPSPHMVCPPSLVVLFLHPVVQAGRVYAAFLR
ncbi:MAG: Modification methylase BamHI [Verrucomicrobia subdivision 3 bacterium]|nr:Modification methylase BamHI [Limisphaerales bacterium]